MDKVALVNFDIENGKEVIYALDRAERNPRVALWAKLPEYEDWRLVIASDRLQQAGSLGAYSQINAALEEAEIPVRRRPMDKPFIKALRGFSAQSADAYGMRLGGQTFGDRYVEDAFVYRIR